MNLTITNDVTKVSVPIPVYDSNPSDLYNVLMGPYDMDDLGGYTESDGAQTGPQMIYGIQGKTFFAAGKIIF